jgi:hypothetical protein
LAGNQESGRCPRGVGMFASGDHARFSDHLTRRIYAPILKKCRFARFMDPLTREKSLFSKRHIGFETTGLDSPIHDAVQD